MNNVTTLRADRIKVELVRTNLLTRWPCHCCGGHTEKYPVLAEVTEGEYKGFRICENCLKAGDIPERIMHRADELEAEVATIREMARRLDYPTYAQWEKANRDHDDAYCREVYGKSLEEVQAEEDQQRKESPDFENVPF